MSIRLLVEKYCQNCPEFEADVEKTDFCGSFDEIHQTTVLCKHRERCKEMRKYLRKEMKEKETRNDRK